MYNRIDDIINILKQLNITIIKVLLCHDLGEKKYVKLNMKHSKYCTNKNLADCFCDKLYNNGITAKLLSI